MAEGIGVTRMAPQMLLLMLSNALALGEGICIGRAHAAPPHPPGPRVPARAADPRRLPEAVSRQRCRTGALCQPSPAWPSLAAYWVSDPPL